ncbi:MAG: oligopeptide transporter, OPT family, partial [Gammaproteobacteria bacterium]|nr:oligopeptide transporter, OPT family [Gammaproteobacteria bacterium]
GFISFCQTGFQVITDHFFYWVKTPTTIFGFGLGLSPALIAAGYIVGINVSISMMVGVAIGWVIGIPAITAMVGLPDTGSATDIAISIWRGHTRYIGVGTMIVGGLWTLVTLFKPIKNSLVASMDSLKAVKKGIKNTTLRTERDIPISYVFGGSLLLLIPIFILIYTSIIPADSAISQNFRAVLAGFGTIYILVAGFVFCSVASYFAGLIGSTNTPGSGLLVSALLILCLIFLAFFTLNGGMNGRETLGVILGVGCTVVIGAGVVIANDTMQDLKVGEVVGATPWKQQVMLILGTIVAAFVMPPILELLYQAYGIGGAFPRPNMNPAQMLSAPQAGLMAAVAQGVYAHNLPWLEIGFGAFIAVICIFIDEFLKLRGTRLPVLAVGVGIYLPLDASIPVIIGGLLSYIIQLRLNKRYPSTKTIEREKQMAPHKHRGLLLSCGIVAGASVMGVILAIPFAIKQSSDALKIMPDQYESLAGILGLIVTFILCAWIYRVVMKKS